jgi:hypothetical protein
LPGLLLNGVASRAPNGAGLRGVSLLTSPLLPDGSHLALLTSASFSLSDPLPEPLSLSVLCRSILPCPASMRASASCTSARSLSIFLCHDYPARAFGKSAQFHEIESSVV